MADENTEKVGKFCPFCGKLVDIAGSGWAEHADLKIAYRYHLACEEADRAIVSAFRQARAAAARGEEE